MDVVVDRIFELIKQANKTAKEVAVATGIPASNFTEWKKGRAKPSTDKLPPIADYFGVSVDYLLGRTDDPTWQPRITVKREGEDAIDEATPEEREMLQAVLEAYRREHKK